jgi:hypothetical protein
MKSRAASEKIRRLGFSCSSVPRVVIDIVHGWTRGAEEDLGQPRRDRTGLTPEFLRDVIDAQTSTVSGEQPSDIR